MDNFCAVGEKGVEQLIIKTRTHFLLVVRTRTRTALFLS